MDTFRSKFRSIENGRLSFRNKHKKITKPKGKAWRLTVCLATRFYWWCGAAYSDEEKRKVLQTMAVGNLPKFEGKQLTVRRSRSNENHSPAWRMPRSSCYHVAVITFAHQQYRMAASNNMGWLNCFSMLLPCNIRNICKRKRQVRVCVTGYGGVVWLSLKSRDHWLLVVDKKWIVNNPCGMKMMLAVPSSEERETKWDSPNLGKPLPVLLPGAQPNFDSAEKNVSAHIALFISTAYMRQLKSFLLNRGIVSHNFGNITRQKCDLAGSDNCS